MSARIKLYRAAIPPPAPGSPAGRAAAPRGPAVRPPAAPRHRTARSGLRDSSTTALIDGELAVGAEFDDQRAEQHDRRAAAARPREWRAGASAGRAVRPRTRTAAMRAVIRTIGLLLAREIEQMKQRALVEVCRPSNPRPPARRSPARPAPFAAVSACARSSARRPVGPDRGEMALAGPSGPTSSMMRFGHSGQPSTSARPAALAGPSRKLSRVRLSACGSANAS